MVDVTSISLIIAAVSVVVGTVFHIFLYVELKEIEELRWKQDR